MVVTAESSAYLSTNYRTHLAFAAKLSAWPFLIRGKDSRGATFPALPNGSIVSMMGERAKRAAPDWDWQLLNTSSNVTGAVC